jgi:hypothetical protein
VETREHGDVVVRVGESSRSDGAGVHQYEQDDQRATVLLGLLSALRFNGFPLDHENRHREPRPGTEKCSTPAVW